MADPSALSASDPHVRSNERAFLVEVLRTGYLWHQRTLRAAMVRVRG